MLGTIAGLWIAVLLLLFGVIAAVGVMIGSTNKASGIEERSILYLDLNGEIAERRQAQSLMSMIQDMDDAGTTLADMLSAIRLAANDQKIEGIYINASGSSMGVASREELVEALEDFKKSGKWIYAYADYFSQGDYLVSSCADKIIVNPAGNVAIRGVGTTTPFFTGLLNKLGIKVQVVKVGTYKSAVEPFILTSMSDAARRQNQVYVDSIWSFYSSTIGANLGVPPQTVGEWADSLTFAWTARHDIDAGIVTDTYYRRQVEEMLRGLTDIGDDEGLRLVTPAQYVDNNAKKFGNRSDRHIAVLYAVGDIVDSGDEGIAGSTMVPAIIDLADDDNVAALVFRVNSGGGSAFASEQIWEALEYFKSKGKPFYVSMGDYAASGGYYISCGADRIFADATTLTGSIGVFGLIPDLSGLMTDKLGITFSTVESGPNASFMSLTGPLSPSQMKSMQQSVEDTYDTFTSRVAEGRNMSVDSVKAIAEGRVWIGSSALEIGLVDELGSLNDAINAIAEEAGLDASSVVAYPEYDDNMMERLLRESYKLKARHGIILDNDAIKYMVAIKRLREMSPIQARMPELEIE